jgi:uncharacterized SAM-binding protein YcdF (DUF218 family)
MRRNRTRTADAIVVLGCRAPAALKRRLERGVELFREKAAPLLVLSGGGAGPIPEAEIMRDTALGRGVPSAALLIEAGSRSTRENARETARLLGSRGFTAVLLVSDRAHLPRAALLFRLAGLKVAGWAAPPCHSIRWEVRLALRELGALPRGLTRAFLKQGSAGRRLRLRSWRPRPGEKSPEC